MNKISGSLIWIVVCLLLNGGFGQFALQGQEESTFVDERDDQLYKTVTYTLKLKDSLVKMTWMAQNLNFEMPNTFCFNNNPDSCTKSGRLYDWQAANKACPAGWHLPNDEEWYQLVDLFGGIDRAGRHMKANKKIWPLGKGTGKSLFNGLPTGTSDPNGFYKADAGFFWSATIGLESPDEASDWSFVPWSNQMRHWQGMLTIGNGVRCVKD